MIQPHAYLFVDTCILYIYNHMMYTNMCYMYPSVLYVLYVYFYMHYINNRHHPSNIQMYRTYV